MTKTCSAFFMEDPAQAYAHLDAFGTVARRYGSSAHGHDLYVWDDGSRHLLHCSACDAFILVQRSEYHGMEDDDYYSDFFPVSSPEEADELNRRYDGYAIERAFPRRYLMKTNHLFGWSHHPADAIPSGDNPDPTAGE